MQENVHHCVALAIKTIQIALAGLRVFADLCALSFSYQIQSFLSDTVYSRVSRRVLKSTFFALLIKCCSVNNVFQRFKITAVNLLIEIFARLSGFTVFDAVSKINYKSDNHPNQKTYPGVEWERCHFGQTNYGAHNWNKRHPRGSESTGSIGFRFTKYNYSYTYNNKSQQCPD